MLQTYHHWEGSLPQGNLNAEKKNESVTDNEAFELESNE